ncbi:uncharacterized protein LOC131652681 [Vicia villosa]|uniref:uncharacterized protein LOC131652681 n=1 Tax=Vicia villosa TaxID=3911 RepID=UPI00273BBA73|nr:uncharacterized protein LOC131652681 [Vicia villosa]
MTGQKEAFINIDSSFGSKVKLGNGEHVEVKGKGSIGVTTKQGSKVIHDTLYVPELDENLLSIGQLLEHGYSLNFENRECRIFDSERRSVTVVKMTSNRSFPLSFNYEKNVSMMAREENDSCLWHRKSYSIKRRWCMGCQESKKNLVCVKDVSLENTTGNHFQRKAHGEPNKCWNLYTQMCMAL